MERQTEATKAEIEVMEPIALCGEEEEDEAIEVENKVDCGNQSLMSILRAKLHKVKRVCRNQLLQYGVIEKLDTTRVYQVWPGRSVKLKT